MKPWVLAAALIGCGATVSALPIQQPVEIAFSAGRVTLSASDARVADLMAAWAREGHVELAGAEYLGARRISLRLTNASEADTLRAIVGSPSWYTTVLRESPAASESLFQRIVILPAAETAAQAAKVVDPERRYTYYSDPEADAAAQAMVAAAAAAPRPKNLRPADVDPEVFYHYEPVAPDAPDPLGIMSTPASTKQPLPRALDPEAIYTYAPTPEPAEPVLTSAVIPPTPALDPEARYTYAPTPQEIPTSMLPPAKAVKDEGSGLPEIEVFVGLANLPRMPGRAIRFFVSGG